MSDVVLCMNKGFLIIRHDDLPRALKRVTPDGWTFTVVREYIEEKLMGTLKPDQAPVDYTKHRQLGRALLELGATTVPTPGTSLMLQDKPNNIVAVFYMKEDRNRVGLPSFVFDPATKPCEVTKEAV